MTLRQPVLTVGITQASSVIAVDRSSEAESGTVTQSLTPSRVAAVPKRPSAQPAPFASVPLLPRPEESVAVVPLPSSKP